MDLPDSYLVGHHPDLRKERSDYGDLSDSKAKLVACYQLTLFLILSSHLSMVSLLYMEEIINHHIDKNYVSNIRDGLTIPIILVSRFLLWKHSAVL